MSIEIDPQFRHLIPEYQEVLAKVQNDFKTRIRPLQQLTGGRTGALLYLVSATSENNESVKHYVLKLDHAADWGKGWENEAERHRKACELTSNDFCQKHMARLVYKPVELERALAVMYTIAGSSLLQCRPLASFSQQTRLKEIYSILGRSLVDEWNKGTLKTAENWHPQDILRHWLGYRLDSGKGDIHKFLINECGFGPETDGFIVGGKILPNPVAYGTNRKFWGNTRGLDILRGLIHGDLHGNNILVEYSQYGDDLKGYYLVDFANFAEGSPLLYDHAYLELSYLLPQSEGVSFEKWIDFAEILASDDIPDPKFMPTELAGAGCVIRTMRSALDMWIRENHASLRDDLWGLYRLAATAVGMNFCNKTALTREERFHSLAYSAIYLNAHCLYFNIPHPSGAKELRLKTEQFALDVGTAWEPFLDACHSFERERIFVLACGDDLRDICSLLGPLGRVPWSLVLDFDPNTQAGGLCEYVRDEIESRRALHIITCEEKMSLNPARATYWYAARGLAGRSSTFPKGEEWLDWKLKYNRPLAELLTEVASSSGEQPVTFLNLWHNPSYVRKICDLLTDTFGDRLEIVFATPSLEPILEISKEYSARTFPLEATQIAAGLEKLFRRVSIQEDLTYLPSANNRRAAIDPKDVAFLQEEITLVHLGVGIDEEQEDDRSSSFLQGEKITWFELSLHKDVSRTKTDDLRSRVEGDLAKRLTTQFNLYHRPGGGGSTVARRIAWDLHHRFPTIVIHKISGSTVGRLQLIRSLTSLPILAIIETSECAMDLVDSLFLTTKSENISAVFLTVSRKFDSINEEERVRYLRETLNVDEAGRFAEVYGREKSDRLALLRDLARNEKKKDLRAPFYFGLTAFDADFVQLDTYVRARLEGMSQTEEKVVCYIALAYRYGHQTLPAQMFAQILGLSCKSTVRLEKALDKKRLNLLIRETKNNEVSWRPTHQIIAVEISEQILAGDFADRRLWQDNLSTWAIRFIDDCELLFSATSRVHSERIRELLSQIFILRESGDILGATGTRFSKLIEDIPATEGRLSVLQALVNRFPDEAHYWAHLGRYQSYQKDHAEALVSIQKAVELSDKDRVLHHMKGMALRTHAYDLMHDLIREVKKEPLSGEPSDAALTEIKDLWQQSAEAFALSRELDPYGEAGYVSHIQLLTNAVEFGFRLSGKRTYEEFLTDLDSVEYQDKVEEAEALLSDLKRLQGGEGRRFSHYVEECETRLSRVMGDYSKTIEGWKKMLVRGDVHKPPIRRRLVLAYLGSKNRSWEELEQKDLNMIVELMEENLLAEPGNERNIRLWFDAARRTSTVTIDAAIERLSYWSARSDLVDPVYYLYMLQALKTIEGSAAAKLSAERFCEECRRRARNLPYRRHSYNWLGSGVGMKRLVHYALLGEWDREKDFWTNTMPLVRMHGLITRIHKPEAGTIELDCGLEAFFVPGRLPERGVTRERHENKPVTFLLGFSYDGLRAWRVELE